MQIIPLFDKIVVTTTLNNNEKTKSGFILPFSAQEKQQIAKVIAVGNGGKIDGEEVEMQVKVGDTILYAKYAGNDFKLEGKDFTIIKQSDVLAILK